MKKSVWLLLSGVLGLGGGLQGQTVQGKEARVSGQSDSFALGPGALAGSIIQFSTFDDNRNAPPLAENFGGSPFYGREARPLGGGSADFLTDYIVFDSGGQVTDYGAFAIPVNLGDSDFNGIPDQLQFNRATSTSGQVVAQADFPGTGTFLVGAVFNRPAGEGAGVYNFRFPGTGSFGFEGQFRILDWGGTIEYARGETNTMRFEWTFTRPDGVTERFSGESEFTVPDANQIVLPPFTLANEANQTVVNEIGAIFNREDTTYRGRVRFVDGFTATSWADYLDHTIEFEDDNDFDLDGVPDLSDEVLSLPVITAHPQSAAVGAGQPVTLRVEASSDTALTYGWRFNGSPLIGANSAEFHIPSFQANNVGLYDVIVQNAGGWVFSEAAALSLAFPPVIVAHPQGQSVVAGGNATLQVSAEGTAPLAYAWTRNGFDLPDADGPVLTIEDADAADAGSYLVTVSNSAGFAVSDPATLIVLEAPRFVAQPVAETVASIGGQASFSVVLAGSEPIAVQWRRDGTPLLGAVSRELVLTDLELEDAGLYDVVATNAAGTATSEPASLTVGQAPEFTLEPMDVSATAGDRVTFSALATGAPAATYQWRRDGLLISGAVDPDFTIASVTALHAGTYTVVASNALGTATSAPAVLSVRHDLLSARMTADGSLEVTLHGAGGGSFLIETSNDLVSWDFFLRFDDVASERVFQAPIDAANRARYYRARPRALTGRRELCLESSSGTRIDVSTSQSPLLD